MPKNPIDCATTRSGATAQSLSRLSGDTLAFGDDHGVYANRTPRFADFLRRHHPCLDEDC